MSPVLRPTVAWLLAFFMPFQALTAIYLDVRGPAHVHVGADEAHRSGRDAHVQHERLRGHEYSHVVQAMGLQAHGHDRGHSHSHGPNGVDRHHHHPGDPSVVTIEDHGLSGDFALKEETAPGWSGAMLVALPANGSMLRLTAGASAPALLPESLLQTRTLGRLERPPRLLPA